MYQCECESECKESPILPIFTSMIRTLFLLLLLPVVSMAQTGSISISFFASPGDTFTNHGQFRLMLHGQEVERLDYFNCPSSFDSLQPGTYELQLYLKQERVMTLHAIEVVANEDTEVNHYYYLPEIAKSDTVTQETFEVWLNGSMSQSPAASNWRIGFYEGFCSHYTKHLGIGFVSGFEYGRSVLATDTTFTTLPDRRAERYNGVTWGFTLFQRFTAFDPHKKAYGPTLDVGLHYALPISFRHVFLYESGHKEVFHRIHLFNDLRAMASIGFRPVMLFASYRFFNTLKGNRPQEPNFNVGVSINVSGQMN
jgi:hypothetical protein